ncbi:hypothetical protein J27TS8_39950 [Robertmurraya siralis]|uniref:Uncharacterized protein n=1 Tax=Robertmurraya siralis TaxID=77777 RepID=A0A919WLU6_9BACI|nr:hypothetical protein [Robertmurraya siralis]GIN64002.1 hypothetical protein J27TS8_39950 [Robertmurraya siralis]
MDKRIFYLILQIVSIIGILIFTYYFVWDEQLVKFIIFSIVTVSIILLGYYFFHKKSKRNNKGKKDLIG